jgi:hypothetical protein
MPLCLHFLRPYTLASSRPISRTSQAAYVQFFGTVAVHYGPKLDVRPGTFSHESGTAERLRELGFPKVELYPRITPHDMRMDLRAFTKTFDPLKISELTHHRKEVVLQGNVHQFPGPFLSSRY